MIGDSKTTGFGAIPGRFAAGKYECLELPARIATTGWSVTDVQIAIDAALAARSDTPQYILINLGANNIPYAGTTTNRSTETFVKADYNYILAVLNVKYPGVPVYLMRPWYRGFNANSDTFAGWIADLVTANANAHLGPDERVFLEGGDNGVTWTADGVHPNDAGYTLTAKKWLQAIGL